LDDGDLEVEDAGSLWISGQSKVLAAQSSNIQTQLTHVLVEGASSINIESNSSWMVTQEFDFTPAQGEHVPLQWRASDCSVYMPLKVQHYVCAHTSDLAGSFNRVTPLKY
jgi:hypothetical protein